MEKRAKVMLLSVWAARAVVSGVFLAAGGLKAVHPAAFAAEIEHYRMVSPALATLLAASLPYLELGAGVGLWAPKWRRASGVLIALMLVVFVVALASAWARGLDIHCGCFGTSAGAASNFLWWIGRDLLLLALLGWQERTPKCAEVGNAG